MPFNLETIEVRQGIRELAQESLDAIDADYGPQSNNFLQNHNTSHTLAVIEAGYSIARAMHLGSRAIDAVVVATAFHDRVHHLGPIKNEEASGTLALEAIERYNQQTPKPPRFNQREKTDIDEMIHGTICHVYRGRLVQHARSSLQYIVADADLHTFGGPEINLLQSSIDLFKENNPDAAEDPAKLLDFLRGTRGILAHHRYKTPAARRLFPHVMRNVAFLDQIIETGDIPALSL